MIYGAAQVEGKVSFLAELSSVCQHSLHPLTLCEDFNITINEYVKNKEGGYDR